MKLFENDGGITDQGAAFLIIGIIVFVISSVCIYSAFEKVIEIKFKTEAIEALKDKVEVKVNTKDLKGILNGSH